MHPKTMPPSFKPSLETLVSQYHPSLYRYALSLIPNPTDAEDLLGEALLEAVRSFPQLIYQEAFLPWIRRIIQRLSADYWEKQRKSQRLQEKLEGAYQAGLLSSPSDPDKELEKAELRRALKEALSTLPEHERQAILLCKFQDYTYQEAGQLLGVPVTTIRNWLHRGMHHLNTLLAPLLKEE